MSEKKLSIKNNSKEFLEAIVKEHGIDTIKDFVNSYNKKNRKKSIRVNNYKDIAIKVYNLIMYKNYSKTRAIDKIAEDNNSSSNTVRNHCAKFDKEAKEFDFYSFCAIAEKYNYSISYYNEEMLNSEYADINKVDVNVFEVYLYKYKKLTIKERKGIIIDYDKFNILQKDKQQQPYYQSPDTKDIPF